MENIFWFLLKSMISGLLFTCYYWCFLRNKAFHNYNRFYLLSAMLLSLILPLFPFRWIYFNMPRYGGINRVVFQSASATGWISIAAAIIILVSSILLTGLLAKIIQIYQVIRSHPRQTMNGFVLVETELQQAPFTFLNHLFWRSDISLDDEAGSRIYQHELTHIKEGHTYDKLFSQLVVCVFWVNPFCWIIQKELNMIHEFIADGKCLGRGDVESLADMLLKAYCRKKFLDPVHFFFHSPIKRRLTMLAGTRKASYSRLRRLMVAPVLIVVVMFCSFHLDKSRDELLKKQLLEKIKAEEAAMNARK